MTTQGPNVSGEVSLDTKDLTTAIEKIQKLEKAMYRSSNQISQATENVTKAVSRLSQSITGSSSAASQAAKVNDQVTRSQDGLTGSTERYQGSLTAAVNAINKVEVSQQRLEARIRESAMSERDKTEALSRSRVAMQAAISSIDQYGNRSVNAATQVARFRKEATGVGIAVASANRSFRGQQIQSFQAEFRNLTGSVVLALGPLSGVASRLMALQGLFNRGGFAIAGFLASMTGMTVTMINSAKASMEAETQFLRMNSIITSMGASAGVSAQEIMEMGHTIAAATLTSAAEARKAALALAGFGGVATENFERVLITAQGLSEQFGGDLAANTKVLARALQDPERRLTTLERKVGAFTETTRKQIQTMARQGDVAGAQALILERLSNSYDLARDAAGGIAGSLDTTSGLMDKLYERIGLASGAMDAATNQVNRFNESFEEFINSDAAETIGRTLVNAINAAGNAINFLAERAEYVAFLMSALMGGAILRVLSILLKLGPVVMGVGKAVAAFGGILVGATTAARGLSLALTALNPMVGVMRVAAFLAAPAIGALVTRFISSGEEADEAAEAMRKFREEMDNSSRQAKALSDIDPGLTQLAEDLATGTNVLATFQERLSETETILNNLESRGIESTLNRVAERSGVTAEQIRENANMIEASLNSALDPDPSGTSLTQAELDRISSELLSLRDSGESLLTYLNRSQALQRFQSHVENLTETVEKQSEAITERTAAAEAFRKELDKNSTATQDLASSYDKETEALEKLNNDLIQAQSILASYRNMQGRVNERNGEVSEGIETLQRVIANLNKEIEEAEAKAMELSSAYGSLSDDLHKMSRETKNLQDMANKGTDDLTRQFGIMDQIAAAQAAINELKNHEIDALSVQLGLSRQVNESFGEFRTRVSDAYGSFIQENMDAQHQAREFLDIQNQINESFKGLQDTSQIEDIANKYSKMREDLSSASGQSGDTQALLDKITQMEQIELSRLKAHTEELMKFRVGMTSEELTTLKETRSEMLAEMYGEESEQYKQHLENMNEAAAGAEMFSKVVENAEFASGKMKDLMGVMQTLNREHTKEYQTLAKAEVLISSAKAVAAALPLMATNPFKGAMTMAMIGAQAGASMAQIDSAFASGGYVSGPGSATSDSIPAWLSNGEYVLQSSAVRKLGIDNLDMLNQGKMPAMSTGGPVPIMSMSGGGSNGGGVSISIIDQRSNKSSPIEVDTSRGEDDIRIIVREMINESYRSGDADPSMMSNYGVSRKPRKR